jgi:6-phosphogluconolactonase
MKMQPTQIFAWALFSGLALGLLAGVMAAQAGNDYFAYIGTYTNGTSKGIYAFRYSGETGKLTPIGLVAETASPSFLAVHPNHRFLYAVGEISEYEGQPTGLVLAYAIDPKTGRLTFLNRVVSRGAGPCHVAVDQTGRIAIVANYSSGSVTAFRIGSDGKLGEVTAFVQDAGSSVNRQRQAGPHAHGVFFSPDNRFVVVPDLGVDKLFVYRPDLDKGSLEAADPPFASVKPGAGPRHFAFHPSGRFGYAIDELDSTVTAFHYDKTRGVLRPFETVSILPPDFHGASGSAEIEVDRQGKFLYASNRGADIIAVFAIGPDGSLKLVERVPTQGKIPRNFAIDPTGSYLLAANQDTNNVVVFRRDQATGRLTPAGQQVEVGAPVCVIFVPVPERTQP